MAIARSGYGTATCAEPVLFVVSVSTAVLAMVASFVNTSPEASELESCPVRVIHPAAPRVRSAMDHVYVSRPTLVWTTAGPLLVPLRYDPTYPARVECGAFRARVRGFLRTTSDLDRAAIHVGAFVGQAYDVLVIHNDDPWQRHDGNVHLRAAGNKTKVLDLLSLKAVRLESPSRTVGLTYPTTIRFPKVSSRR